MPRPLAWSLWLMSRLLPPIRRPNSDVCAIAGIAERSRHASGNAIFLMRVTIRGEFVRFNRFSFVVRASQSAVRTARRGADRGPRTTYNVPRVDGALHLGT